VEDISNISVSKYSTLNLFLKPHLKIPS